MRIEDGRIIRTLYEKLERDVRTWGTGETGYFKRRKMEKWRLETLFFLETMKPMIDSHDKTVDLEKEKPEES